jgi:DNA-binding NtrC family response regulator
MTPLRVLIVDDDTALLEALPETLRLRMGGVIVETANSAAAALERIAVDDYDAIVTDIKMPGMDGLELLAEIRSRRPGTPTLIITGHGENELVVRALRGGACDFIQKPIDRDYFVAALYRAIRAQVASRQTKDRQLALEAYRQELERVVERLERGVSGETAADESRPGDAGTDEPVNS